MNTFIPGLVWIIIWSIGVYFAPNIAPGYVMIYGAVVWLIADSVSNTIKTGGG